MEKRKGERGRGRERDKATVKPQKAYDVQASHCTWFYTLKVLNRPPYMQATCTNQASPLCCPSLPVSKAVLPSHLDNTKGIIVVFLL